MKEHYKQLERQYGAEVTTINLLSKTKSPEKELKNVSLLKFRDFRLYLIGISNLIIFSLI